jgi:hypothetical protein
VNASLRDVAIGALLGSLAVAGALALLVVIGILPEAPWVTFWTAFWPSTDWVVPGVVGGLAFIAIGVVWGLPFALVQEPSTFKGVVYGVLPTLWALTGVPLLLDQAPMGGLDPIRLGVPIVMNCLIWGSFLGWYAHRKVFGDGGGGAVYY